MGNDGGGRILKKYIKSGGEYTSILSPTKGLYHCCFDQCSRIGVWNISRKDWETPNELVSCILNKNRINLRWPKESICSKALA